MLWSTQGIDHGRLMDRVYRHQRYFYDATRKYYLLGRDPMIKELNVPDGGHVLEIGCGTGRNLIKAAHQYPKASFYGIDISNEMLMTAQKAAQKSDHPDRLSFAYADAAAFDPQSLFGRNNFDRIFISYAVSMIPQWQQVIRESLSHLAPGGTLHIVDFGDQSRLPRWFKSALYTWLNWYHVTPRQDLFAVCHTLAAEENASSSGTILYRGFAWIAKIRR